MVSNLLSPAAAAAACGPAAAAAATDAALAAYHSMHTQSLQCQEGISTWLWPAAAAAAWAAKYTSCIC